MGMVQVLRHQLSSPIRFLFISKKKREGSGFTCYREGRRQGRKWGYSGGTFWSDLIWIRNQSPTNDPPPPPLSWLSLSETRLWRLMRRKGRVVVGNGNGAPVLPEEERRGLRDVILENFWWILSWFPSSSPKYSLVSSCAFYRMELEKVFVCLSRPSSYLLLLSVFQPKEASPCKSGNGVEWGSCRQ